MTTARHYTQWSEAALRDAAAAAVERAVALGADAASANVRAGGGVRFVARGGTIETRLRDGYQSLGVTVFRDGRNGSASATALDSASIARVAEEAVAIARRVEPDAGTGLADRDWLAWDGAMPALDAGDQPEADELIATTTEIEAGAARHDAGVRVVEAGTTSQEALMALATSDGFCRSAASSLHGRWLVVMAQGAGGAMQDHADGYERRLADLPSAGALAAQAVTRATGRLGARAMPGGTMPVLFDPRVAPAIVGDLVGALSGGSQERGTTFLRDAIGRAVAADHLDLIEDPSEPYGMASGGFDAEGVAGSRRPVVEGGVATGYFLATRSARRLGMRSTGNANGPWNLSLRSRLPGGDLDAMLARLGDGLFVTHLLGGATDPVTGNWTRAVAGFRVVGGRIDHPVIDVTVGGDLARMLHAIVAVGDDVERHGAIRSGSILIDGMTVGGTA
ncbi:MAG: metallopeptidase TldD-related protein [Sphingomonas adhaesiva]